MNGPQNGLGLIKQRILFNHVHFIQYYPEELYCLGGRGPMPFWGGHAQQVKDMVHWKRKGEIRINLICFWFP